MNKEIGRVISGVSLGELRAEIDAHLLRKSPGYPVRLITPENASIITAYRGFPIRRWDVDGKIRYDTAYSFEKMSSEVSE